jgi:hypothetical protein
VRGPPSFVKDFHAKLFTSTFNHIYIPVFLTKLQVSLVWKRRMNKPILHSFTNSISNINVLVIPNVQMFDMCEVILMKLILNDTEF